METLWATRAEFQPLKRLARRLDAGVRGEPVVPEVQPPPQQERCDRDGRESRRILERGFDRGARCGDRPTPAVFRRLDLRFDLRARARGEDCEDQLGLAQGYVFDEAGAADVGDVANVERQLLAQLA